MEIRNSEVTLELLDEEYEIIANHVRKKDRIERIKNIINKSEISENVKSFLLANEERLNLLGINFEKELYKTEDARNIFNWHVDSFDILTYQIICNNGKTYTAQLARSQFADIHDIVYNQIPVNRDIYDVNGEQIKISDIVDISERRIA